jgi:hypothetical protein
MGFFSKSASKPVFSRFSEQHFRTGVLRVLWEGEELIADGFFEDGPDPLGEEDGLKGIFGGNSHTYLAATNWRIILGYLANGDFVSFEYSNIEPQNRKAGSKIYFTYSNPVLKASNSPTFRSTYSISNEVAAAIERNLKNIKPVQSEQTQIHLSRKSWGEGPLADLAKLKSGRDYMFIEVCTKCTGTMLVPDDIESAPEKGNLQCRTCLRIKGNK